MVLLKALPALFLALAPVAAVPETPAPVPIDTIARAKFPNEEAAFVDALAEMNRAVNAKMTYELDQDHYGVTDLWVMAPDDAKGDCEDYALTKLFVLGEAGYPIVTNAKLVLVAVHDKGQRFGHAILAVLMPHGSVAYLDMRDEPMTRDELVKRGYEFFDWKA
jgi:predicted transglutaminase-like cysteine proteinase